VLVARYICERSHFFNTISIPAKENISAVPTVHGKKEDILLSSKENNLLLTPFWKRLRVDQYPKTL
jgi:hypothetical protein